jgi:hypothetical protein
VKYYCIKSGYGFYLEIPAEKVLSFVPEKDMIYSYFGAWEHMLKLVQEAVETHNYKIETDYGYRLRHEKI